ncbi:MAG: outer membrane beta-barrel protein [Verrucomicrobiota bacterium]|nr:outer membrane beta-barrel protein [Verrucomicrobiota bacterium]
MSRYPYSRLARSPFFAIAAAAVTFLTAISVANAQDAVRPSLAGESAAEARHQDIDHIPYNLMTGPIKYRVSATVGVEYNDNINLSQNNELSDFIFRPQVNIDALWPITQLNTLRFDIGLGYAFYADHSNQNTNTILLAPNSQIGFDIFVGDFRINIHDRFSAQQDPIDQLAVSNVVDYGRFENYAGVSVLWDLNKAVVSLSYDHYNYVSTTSMFDYLDRNAEELTASVSFAVTSTTGVGLEGTFVHNTYDQHVLNDSDTLSGGVFVETQLTNYLKVRVAGGYQSISFSGGGLVNDGSDVGDFYANMLLSHRLNAAITQTLSAGHENQLGVNSNSIALNYVRHTVNWNIVRNTLLSTEVFFEDADDSGGFIHEHLHRYGGALSLGYQLTPHVTLGLRYQYTQKDSDVALRDYTQNRVSVDATYSF